MTLSYNDKTKAVPKNATPTGFTNPDAAHNVWQHALDILAELHHPNADDVRAKMKLAPCRRLEANS